MGTPLLVVGAGGHGKVVADAALLSGRFTRVAFLDDRFPEIDNVVGHDVLGVIADRAQFLEHYRQVIIAMGENDLRLELLAQFETDGFDVVTVIHPSAVIAGDVTVGNGSAILASAIVNASATIGTGCIVNTAAVVEHDCQLGDGVHMSPMSAIAGAVVLGERCWIGMGACVIGPTEVGKRAIVGAGAVVRRNVDADTVVAGVPAKVLR